MFGDNYLKPKCLYDTSVHVQHLDLFKFCVKTPYLLIVFLFAPLGFEPSTSGTEAKDHSAIEVIND